ncbi:unnamed protein product, partial [Lampetra planeri]
GPASSGFTCDDDTATHDPELSTNTCVDSNVSFAEHQVHSVHMESNKVFQDKVCLNTKVENRDELHRFLEQPDAEINNKKAPPNIIVSNLTEVPNEEEEENAACVVESSVHSDGFCEEQFEGPDSESECHGKAPAADKIPDDCEVSHDTSEDAHHAADGPAALSPQRHTSPPCSAAGDGTKRDGEYLSFHQEYSRQSSQDIPEILELSLDSFLAPIDVPGPEHEADKYEDLPKQESSNETAEGTEASVHLKIEGKGSPAEGAHVTPPDDLAPALHEHAECLGGSALSSSRREAEGEMDPETKEQAVAAVVAAIPSEAGGPQGGPPAVEHVSRHEHASAAASSGALSQVECAAVVPKTTWHKRPLEVPIASLSDGTDSSPCPRHSTSRPSGMWQSGEPTTRRRWTKPTTPSACDEKLGTATAPNTPGTPRAFPPMAPGTPRTLLPRSRTPTGLRSQQSSLSLPLERRAIAVVRTPPKSPCLSRGQSRPLSAPLPDLKNIRSKVHSTENLKHQPGGGKVHIISKKLDLSHVTSKCRSMDNIGYKPGGGHVKIETAKLEFENIKSKIGSLANLDHTPSGGNVKIESRKLTFRENAKARTDHGAEIVLVSPELSLEGSPQSRPSAPLSPASARGTAHVPPRLHSLAHDVAAALAKQGL